MIPFYPVLVSDQHVETVNFYEDYFGFVPSVEKEGYTLMQQKGENGICIAVIDSSHESVAEKVAPVKGLILSIGVDDILTAYDTLYMEGLDMFMSVSEGIHGQTRFVVTDPNGVLVNVYARDDIKLPEVI